MAFTGLHDAGKKYENFLLVIAYWIAPWLAVVFVDRWLRRGTKIDRIVEDTRYQNWAGPIAMAARHGSSRSGCSRNQTKYLGVDPEAPSGRR